MADPEIEPKGAPQKYLLPHPKDAEEVILEPVVAVAVHLAHWVLQPVEEERVLGLD